MTTPDALGDPVAIAIDAGARLDALGVPWVTAGSLASSVTDMLERVLHDAAR